MNDKVLRECRGNLTIDKICLDGHVVVGGLDMESFSWCRAHMLDGSPTGTYRNRGWSGQLNVWYTRDVVSTYLAESVINGACNYYRGSQYLIGVCSLGDLYVFEGVAGGDPPHVIIVREGCTVDVIFDAESGRQRNMVLRVLRSLGRSRLLSDGRGLMLHASAAVGDYSGALFIGPSGSGKTSSAVEMGMRGLNILSTDRTVFFDEPGRFMAVGGPDIVRLGYGFMKSRLPMDTYNWSVRFPAEDAVCLDAFSFGSRIKAEFGISEFGREVGIGTVDSGIISHVVLPRVTSRRPGVWAVEDESSSFALTCAEILHPDPAFGYPFAKGIADPSTAQSRWREALSRLQIVSLAWNPDDPIGTGAAYDELRAMMR